MPFTPLEAVVEPEHQVSPDQQALRDQDAARIIAAEIRDPAYSSPEDQAALHREYARRFGNGPTAKRRGFTPLGEDVTSASQPRKSGFTPIEEPKPSLLKTIALNNPLTAAGEVGLNLTSQFVALPAAGIAGLATEAGRALRLTEKKGADVVHQVGEALTYQPRGEMGKAAAEVVAYPFEKLAEGGQYAGGKVLDATGSPVLATASDTAINALPMALEPAIGKLRAGRGTPPDMVKTPDGRIEPTFGDPTPQARPHPENDIAPDPAVSAQPSPPPTQAIQQQKPPTRGEHQPMLDEHPSSHMASEIVAQAAAEAGVPLETVLPKRAAPEPAVPVAEAGPETGGAPMRAGLEDGSAPQAMRAGEAGATVPEMMEAAGGPERAGLAGSETAAPTQSGPHAAPGADLPRLDPGPFSSKAIDNELLQLLADEAPAAHQPAIQRELQRRAALEGADQAASQAMAPGANYVPLIDDAHLSAPAPRRPQPIRREDVLHPLLKSLGATIYEGRIKQKGVLGLYTRGKETVRIKRAADIEVAAHEIAHLLDDRIPEIQATWKTDPARATYSKELKGVSYDKKSVTEGFAEFVRLYMTQPAQARAKAPAFSKWFDGFTERHQYGLAIKKAQADMTAWFGQHAIDRARSKIGDRKNFNDAFDGFWDRFRQSTVDDLHGVYRMERDLKGRIEPAGAYETARLSRASQSIAEGAINHGYPVRQADGSIKFQGKGLRQILEPVSGNLEDALLYFVGRSAQELLGQGREHLFTPAEIKAMTDLATPEARKAFHEYQAWNRRVLDFAESAGVINRESRAMWQRQSYMPFHRVGQAGGYAAKPGDWSGIKALTGGTENLRDILGNMTSNAALLIEKAMKNEARQKIAALAEGERGAGKFMTKIPPESRPVRLQKEAVLDGILKALGIDKRDPAAFDVIADLEAQLGAAPGMLEFFMGNQAPAGNNVVAVLNNGKPTFYEVADPVLYRAMSALDRPVQSWVVKLLGLPKRIGQASITLTPDFMIANIARDTLMGGVMSRAGFRPVVDSLQGMRLRMTNDPIYKDFVANGGGMSSIYLDSTKLRTSLEKFYRSQGIDYRTVLDAPEKLLGMVENIADAFETSTRLGEYRRAVEAGQNPRHAAYLAREVSTDFAMRGDSQALNFLYDTVMFLKPAMLSMDRLYRGLAHDPNRAGIAAKAGVMALFSMGLYLLNRDDTRYQDLPDWDRDSHWHFFVGNQHFRFPKTWEIGAMASVAERAVEKTLAVDPLGFGKDLVRVIGQTFSLNLMPQIIAPVVEQYANKNSFTGAPIETPGMENEQPFMRAKPSTSEALKAAGMATRNMPEALQVNPVRAEALLRGYLNTWAVYGLMLADEAVPGADKPAMRADQMPVVRRFYAQEPAKTNRYETEFYDMLGEAKRLRGTLRGLDKLGRADLADEKEKEPLSGEFSPLTRASENLRGINADMRDVRRDTKLSADQKREKLDALMTARNALLKAAVQDSKAAQAKATAQP